MSRKCVSFAIAAILAHGLIVPAFAQSFSCKTTSTCTEAVICSERELGKLDEQMADKYFALKRMSSRKGAQQLLDSQRDWLADRDSCGCNARCLIKRYEQRINEFDQLLDD